MNATATSPQTEAPAHPAWCTVDHAVDDPFPLVHLSDLTQLPAADGQCVGVMLVHAADTEQDVRVALVHGEHNRDAGEFTLDQAEAYARQILATVATARIGGAS